MKTISINKHKVGQNQPVFIIAEAASTHDKKLSRAYKLIDIAVRAKADAVKFQIYSAANLAADIPNPIFKMPKDYKSKVKTLYHLYRKLQAPRDWTPKLANYAKKKGIIFLSTPFDYQAVDELEKINISAYKIGNFEITDLPFLSYIAKKRKPIILSAGMCTLGEIEEAISTIEKAGNKQIILLHCVLGKEYPTQPEEVNLNAIKTMQQAFPYPIGLSDHTLSTAIPTAAVAIGARIVEKHFTLNRGLESFDHHFSLEPNELKQMIKGIRETEKAMGSRFKKPLPTELIRRKRGRRSIFAVKNIKKGEIIKKESIAALRPNVGLAPKYLNLIMGRKARKNIKKNQAINWSCI